MKRAGGLYDRIAEPENLRLAYLKAARGKRGKKEVIEYAVRLDENLRRLRDQLCARAVNVGRYHFFTVHDPKERTICAAAFPERVLHHAVMNVCEPALERFAIHDSYACRKGKGLHEAVLRAQSFARRHPWYLKLDIRKYFDSIGHATVLDLLARRFKDADLLALLGRILSSYEMAPGKGLPIGNLISQHLANFYLGHLDHFVKETLRVAGYVRYMDDFVLWASDKHSLKGHLSAITAFLESRLQLRLKDDVQLNRSARGLPFLGYRIFAHRLDLGPRARRRFGRRLAGFEQEFETGRWSESDLARHAEALLSYVRFADSAGFRRQVVAQTSRAS
ncbi:MAG: hypothetical protein EOM72_04585 [Opitutae bacterium]|nr:hypothetical protein [Opitutae bacterium]